MRIGQSIVYLMYHEIELPGRPICHSEPGYQLYVVRRADFEAQMRWLKSEGWCGQSVGEALANPRRPGVAITFDDGCETDLITAAPLLRELGFNATFYITVGFLGSRGYLSRGQVRRHSDQGFEIGCHSMTHPYLTDIGGTQLHEETTGAKNQLEQIIGCAVNHFSCPGGRWNERVVKAVKTAEYRSMATSRATLNSPRTDPFMLGRVTVLRRADSHTFVRMCRGEGLFRTRLQQVTRGAAQRILGNATYDFIRSWLLGGQSSLPPV